MAIQDLTTWTLVGTGVTVTSTRVTNNADLTSSNGIYIAASDVGLTAFGAGNGDLEFLFETQYTNYSDRPVSIGFSDSIVPVDILLEETETFNGIWWTHRSGNTDADVEPGSWINQTLVEPNPDADVNLSALTYGKLTFNDTTDQWLLSYYSNAARTTALGSGPSPLSANVAFTYMHIGGGNAFRDGAGINFWQQNLDLQLITGPVGTGSGVIGSATGSATGTSATPSQRWVRGILYYADGVTKIPDGTVVRMYDATDDSFMSETTISDQTTYNFSFSDLHVVHHDVYVLLPPGQGITNDETCCTQFITPVA